MAERLYYPITLPGQRLYGREIQIRQFGPSEVENYYVVRRTQSIPALRTLMEATLKGIKVEDLYEPDFLFLIYWQRVNSYSHFPYHIPWQCPTCQSNNTNKLDLTKIVSPSVPDDYSIDGVGLDLPCGRQVVFRLPKETDDIRAADQVKHLQIENPNEGHLRKAELMCMMEFDTNFDTFEKWDLINKVFTPEDIFVIDGFRRLFRYGPDNTLDCICKKCGEKRLVSFRFSIYEFFPVDTDLGDIRARVLLNKPSKHAAKRAGEAVVPKIDMVPTQAPSRIREPAKNESPARGTNGRGEDERTFHTVAREITPDQSDKLVNKVLEQVKHEVSLDFEGPASFDSIVKRDR
jgi:hypothetical protein